MNWLKSLNVFCFILYSSCGPLETKVTNFPSHKLNSYHYPNEKESFQLTSGQEVQTTVYEGPVIFWENHASVEDFLEVLKFKKKVIQADLNYKTDEFKIDSLRLTKNKIYEQIIAANQNLSGETFNELYKDRERQLEKTLNWLNEEMPLGQEAQFETYCQAMIWKFATSDLLKHYKFSERPSPLGMCEDYYRRQNYFSAAECINPSRSPKNYFACFWGESGVLQTDVHYFNSDFELLSGQDLSALKSALKAKSMQSMDFANASILDNAEIEYLHNGIKGSVFVDFSDEPYDNPIVNVLDQLGGLTKDSKLALALITLSKMRSNEIDQSQKTEYSLNDRIYNLHLTEHVGEVKVDLGDIEEFIKLAKKNGDIYGPDASFLVKDSIQKIQLLEKQLKPLDEVIDFYNSPLEYGIGKDLEAKYREWMKIRAETAKFIIQNKMAKAFWPYASLEVSTKGSIIKVTLLLDSKQRQTVPGEGCFDMRELSQIACQSFGSDKQKIDLDLDFDIETGSLIVEVSTPENKNFYLKSLDESPYYQHHELNQSFLVNTKLRMVLMPGVYKNQLKQMTGKGFMVNHNKTYYEASVSLTQKSVGKN